MVGSSLVVIETVFRRCAHTTDPATWNQFWFFVVVVILSLYKNYRITLNRIQSMNGFHLFVCFGLASCSVTTAEPGSQSFVDSKPGYFVDW